MSQRTPTPGAVAEAAKNPGGWVYEIGGGLDPNGAIPPAAIAGAWQVDGAGRITGEFKPNPNYDGSKFPAS
jgi:hypothetical protein